MCFSTLREAIAVIAVIATNRFTFEPRTREFSRTHLAALNSQALCFVEACMCRCSLACMVRRRNCCNGGFIATNGGFYARCCGDGSQSAVAWIRQLEPQQW